MKLLIFVQMQVHVVELDHEAFDAIGEAQELIENPVFGTLDVDLEEYPATAEHARTSRLQSHGTRGGRRYGMGLQ